MKNLILITLISLITISCKQEHKDYVTFSGKILNKNSNKVTISDSQTGYKKEISVSEDGSFKDTLKVKTGFYTMYDGVEYAALYLENGDDIKVTLDTKKFDETIKFSGKGSEESTFLAKSTLNQEEFFMDKDIISLEKEEFDKKMNFYVEEFNSRLIANESNFNPSFVTLQKSTIEETKNYAESIYMENRYVKEVLGKGKPSPKFTGQYHA